MAAFVLFLHFADNIFVQINNNETLQTRRGAESRCGVAAAVNSILKRHAPGLHQLLKSGVQRTGLPLPKMLWGKPVWTHVQLWNRVVWGDSVLRWITECLKPGDVFFDVGAHHGWMSMVAARRIGSNGRVVAFEPSPLSVDFLRYHKRVNRLTQMEIVPKAVTRDDAVTTPFILIGNGDAVMNSLVEIEEVKSDPRGSNPIQVEAITLDSYTQQTGLVPTMIKIDTEGAELWVCEGAKRLLAENHPALIIATHPTWLPKGQKIEDLFALLTSYGYRIVASEIFRYKNTDFGDYLCVVE
jgi:FkbM family methyltransferase